MYLAEETLLGATLLGTAPRARPIGSRFPVLLISCHSPFCSPTHIHTSSHFHSCENLFILCLLLEMPFFLFFPQPCQPGQKCLVRNSMRKPSLPHTAPSVSLSAVPPNLCGLTHLAHIYFELSIYTLSLLQKTGSPSRAGTVLGPSSYPKSQALCLAPMKRPGMANPWHACFHRPSGAVSHVT